MNLVVGGACGEDTVQSVVYIANTKSPKTATVYDCCVSGSQESRLDAFGSQCLRRLQSKGWLGLGSI